jgi:hypothetical protein
MIPSPLPLAQVDSVPPIRHSLPHPSRGVSRFNAWSTGALICLVVAGLIAIIWQDNGGNSTPPERNQLAALTTEEATPDAWWPAEISASEAPWVANIEPEECALDPLTFEEYATIKTTDLGPPEGSYEIVGRPAPDVAVSATNALRGWEACRQLGDRDRERAYYTDAFLFYQGSSVENLPYRQQLEARRTESSRLWTIWAQEIGLEPISVVTDVTPPPAALEAFARAQDVLDGKVSPSTLNVATLTHFEARFNPDEVVLLADGRLMVPIHYVYWADDPWLQAQGMEGSGRWTMGIVLQEVDGAWRIDEYASTICSGKCDWGVDSPGATPIATPRP